MRELETQRYLRTQGLERLVANHAIKAVRHATVPNLVLFKYDIGADFSDPVTQECRGLILDSEDDWRVVAFPYRKFHNHGEGHAAEIDWSTARVYEKLDGSLITLYHYDREWHVSTSGCPDGSNRVNDADLTFAELFWDCFPESTIDKLNPDHCYMFELCAPENRVVVPHKDRRIYLHGARDLVTEDYDEFDVAGAAHVLNVDTPKWFDLSSLESVVTAAGQLEPLQQEGYVVVDGNFNRIKVKSPAYVAIHHAKDKLGSRRQIADIIRKGEHSEALAHFPELQHVFTDVKARYDRIIDDTELVWKTIKDVQDRKLFASMATKHGFSGILFHMKDGKTTGPQRALADMSQAAYERLLGI